jgi:hypothetical protein
MVARVADRLDQLLDRELGRRRVGITEGEVDDILAGAPELDLQPVDLRECVWRERVNTPEVHGHPG